MPSHTSTRRRHDPVVQFSVFTPNRLGRLNDVLEVFRSYDVHVLGLAVVDTTDSAIIRLVVDDPDRSRHLFDEHAFAFTESELLVVAIKSPTLLSNLVSALLQAELNINYLYPFITPCEDGSVLGLSVEDNELAEQILRQHQFRVLKQSDLSR